MEKGQSRVTKLLLSYIDDDLDEVESFVKEIKKLDITTIPEDKINSYFQQGFNKIKLSQEEYFILRNYTGFNFKGINSILRDKWTYAQNGKLDDEKKHRFSENANNISDIIDKYPPNIKSFKVYRGVTIDAFKDYGITNLRDLVYMKDNYIYERGFTSTSLIRETSFFKQEIEGQIYNIEIEIIIPENSQDGMPLIGNNLSYSSGQNEYVINKGSLIKIIDVEIKKDFAYMEGVLIPRKIYDYPKKKGRSK